MNRLACLFVAASLTACVHQTDVKYSGAVRVDSAELIAINPDVKVVADSEKPMIFAVGSYWLFHDAAWYRAETIHGSWTRVDNPPIPVKQLDQPYAFVHWRDDHPAEQTAAAEVDNTVVGGASSKPDFKFKQNPLAFEN